MEVSNYWTQRLLEKWGNCENTRYPVLVVIPSVPGKLTAVTMSEFGELLNADVLDFENRHKDRLSNFIGRADIMDEILKPANLKPVVVTNIEYFYDKWKKSERLDFIRHLLRRDGHHGIILLLYADEDFSPIIRETPQTDRGVIWNP